MDWTDDTDPVEAALRTADLLFEPRPPSRLGGGLTYFLTCGTSAGCTDLVTHLPDGQAPWGPVRAVNDAFQRLARRHGSRALEVAAAQLFRAGP